MKIEEKAPSRHSSKEEGVPFDFKHHDSLPPPLGTGWACALFDMDGVLYDSMPLHTVAWIEAMSKFGIRMTAHDSYMTEGQRGVDTIRQMVCQQQGRDITEQEAQAMYDEKARLFHLMPEAPIIDGVIDLMQKLKSDGLQICIVTGSAQRPLISRLTRDFGAFVDEEHIVTAYDVAHGKPAPEPYLKGLQKAGCAHPEQGIVIENAPMGIRAGVAAGCFTIAVNSGPLPDEVLLAEKPNLLFHSIRELCDKLKTYNS